MTTSPPAGRLPIEDAWRTIADGLHIHRWYLHPAVMLDKRAAELRAAAAAPRPWSPTPPSDGLVEHVRHPAQPAPPPPPPAPDRTIPTVHLCGVPVAAVADEDCFVDPLGFLVARVDRLTGACRLSEDLAAAVTRLVEAAELGYLVQIGVSLVVRTDDEHTTPPLTVTVPRSDDAVGFAAALLAGAAVGWLRLFALSAPTREVREPEYDPAAWTAAVAPDAERGIRLAVLIRLHAAILANGLVSGLDAASTRHRLAALCAEAERTTARVYDGAAGLPLIASDLLTTMFPGPRRFEKYQSGAGAGQAQWPPPAPIDPPGTD